VAKIESIVVGKSGDRRSRAGWTFTGDNAQNRLFWVISEVMIALWKWQYNRQWELFHPLLKLARLVSCILADLESSNDYDFDRHGLYGVTRGGFQIWIKHSYDENSKGKNYRSH
jgi:hypothetical protein